MKKMMAMILSVLLVAGLLAGCTSATPATSNDATQAEQTESAVETTEATEQEASQESVETAAPPVVMGLIAQVFGTQSFNDDVLHGLELAKENLGVDYISIEVPEIADTANSLRTLISQGVNFMVVAGSDYRDGMIEVAMEYPDVKFLYLSEALTEYDNILSVEYRENEGAFMAGALAGFLTQTNNVGAVMAVSEPLQLRYKFGFMAGVKAVNPDCEVQTAFTNSYADVNKGAEVAGAMYSKGADFVGTYAGACNLGVFSAAEKAGEGCYCFGAATGQFDKMPDKIVASVVKPVDEAILTIVSDYISTGVFDASVPRSLGLKENGVTLRYTTNTELLDTVVSADIRAKMDDIISKIESGEIVVPGTEETYNSFTYSYNG